MPVMGNTTSTITMTEQSILFSVLTAITAIIIIVPYIRDIDGKPSNSTVIITSLLACALYFYTITGDSAASSKGDYYGYDSITLNNYSITRDNYTQYSISNGETEFIVTSNEVDKLTITNTFTNYSISIDCKNLYDYIILEDNEQYVIAYEDYVDNQNVFLHYTYIDKYSLSNEEQFLENIKNSFKKYLISDISELLIIGDAQNDKSYVAAYSQDYGYYLLTGENKVSILNRD